MKRKLKPKQKKIARAAKPYNRITGADFKALRGKRTVKKEAVDNGRCIKKVAGSRLGSYWK